MGVKQKDLQEQTQRRSASLYAATIVLILCIVLLISNYFYSGIKTKQLSGILKSVSTINNEISQNKKIIAELSDVEDSSIPLQDANQYARKLIEFFHRSEYRISSVAWRLGGNESEKTISVKSDSATGIKYTVMEVRFNYRYIDLLDQLLRDLKREFLQTAVVSMQIKGAEVVIKMVNIGDVDVISNS